ncbi:DUF2889 domain-containing protein [Paraburkholderia sediminicola]|uniref:DUF2889 domain-containing protein n=1 Tax=Paraburkholderia sediminicola TaxID=458836 RepID=UPI0038BC9376
MSFDARARDLLTPANADAARVLVWDQVQARLSADRTVEAITCQPARPGLQHVVGARGGGHLRRALDDALPEERAAGSPLYLLVDDFAGVSLVAPWAWQHWPELTNDAAGPSPESERVVRAQRDGPAEGVCIGFRPGSSALQSNPRALQNYADVLPLPNPADSFGWHELPLFEGVSMRRSRRIDVWRDGDQICVDAMFQDSASTPAGTRKAVHEYNLEVSANAHSLRLTRVHATPRILPFPECPSAVQNTDRLIGVPLRELRAAVLEHLPKTLGCTHLNDALRALAEVPMMFDALNAA